MRVAWPDSLGLYNNNKLHAAAACNDLHLGSGSGSGSACDGLVCVAASASVAVAVAVAGRADDLDLHAVHVESRACIALLLIELYL